MGVTLTSFFSKLLKAPPVCEICSSNLINTYNTTLLYYIEQTIFFKASYEFPRDSKCNLVDLKILDNSRQLE